MDPWGVCSKRRMANIFSVCDSWIHARCAKIPKVFAKAAKDFKSKSSTDLTKYPV